MSTNSEVIPDTPIDEKIEFSLEQQAKLETILKDRLAQQHRQHELELEALRTQAREVIAKATGTQKTDVREFLTASAFQAQQEGEELQNLQRFFGNNPDSARLASNLMRENPSLYRKMRARFLELARDPGRKIEPMLGFSRTY
jgi:hypothetical protein